MNKLMHCACGDKFVDWSLLLLRVVTGVIFVVHGYQKFAGGVDQFAGFLGSVGVPAALFFAWVVVLVEIIGGLSLILGWWSHWAAKLLAIDMLVATFIVHIPNGFFISQGGYEFTLLLFAVLIVLMSCGNGKWCLNNKVI